MARADAELVSHARELERRDAAIAGDLAALEIVAEHAAALRERASDVRAALASLPGELEELTHRLASARTAAEAAREELASAEERVAALARARRRKQDDLERAEREAATARQLAADAESEVERLHEQLEDLRASEPRLRAEGTALAREAAGVAHELARLPRVPDTDALLPGVSLDDVEQWGFLARSALLVARGTLEAERERLLLEANELAAGALGQSLGTSSVSLVRRRLEQLG